MKKLHSLALYALLAPAITLGAGSVLAAQSADDSAEHSTGAMQGDSKDATKSAATIQSDQSKQSGQSGYQAATDGQKNREQSGMHNRGYLSAAPANGVEASKLIGAEVTTTGDESVGEVQELIIDDQGQVVAIVVSVGGFLGMGEKDVAIGWDDVTRSGASDDQELRISATREDLESAPEFKSQE